MNLPRFAAHIPIMTTTSRGPAVNEPAPATSDSSAYIGFYGSDPRSVADDFELVALEVLHPTPEKAADGMHDGAVIRHVHLRLDRGAVFAVYPDAWPQPQVPVYYTEFADAYRDAMGGRFRREVFVAAPARTKNITALGPDGKDVLVARLYEMKCKPLAHYAYPAPDEPAWSW